MVLLSPWPTQQPFLVLPVWQGSGDNNFVVAVSGAWQKGTLINVLCSRKCTNDDLLVAVLVFKHLLTSRQDEA
jgi:hypothetical protein